MFEKIVDEIVEKIESVVPKKGPDGKMYYLINVSKLFPADPQGTRGKAGPKLFTV